MMVAITTEPWIFNRLLMLMKSTYRANLQKRAHGFDCFSCGVLVGAQAVAVVQKPAGGQRSARKG